MSTVVAIYCLFGEKLEQNIPGRMLAARPERCPDGCDTWHDGPVALGHGHFRVLPEESQEHQPLIDGNIVLTADIRLDNRTELGRGLALAPEQLTGMSDARLLMHCYRRWGIKCLPRLLGDFAFVLWDGDRRMLFAARDPLGERNLCHTVLGQTHLVASDIANLRGHPEFVPLINEDKIGAYLAGIRDDAQETYYQNVNYLLPGHVLSIDTNGARIWSYWNIEPNRSVRYQREEEYADHYIDLLTEAIRCRLRSNGPIGVSLSGGLDSSAVAALAAPIINDGLGARLHSFSYTFDELASCDERQFIDLLVQRFPISPQYLNSDDKWPLKDLEEWPVSPDVVLADVFASLPATVMKAANQTGVRILLTGYYGDVLFTGANYWALDLARQGRFGELAKMTATNFRGLRWRRSFLQFGLRRLIPVEVSQAYRRKRPRLPRLVAPGIADELVARTNLLERLSPRDLSRSDWAPGLWERYQTLSPTLHSQGYASVRYQYNRHGIELMQPYYDRRLVEFVMAVPAYVLGGPDTDRRLHRVAMKGILPEEIRLRRNRTIFVPLVQRGLGEREWGKVQRLLTKPQVVERGYIDANWLRSRLETGWDQSADSTMLWYVLSLELWLQRYWS